MLDFKIVFILEGREYYESSSPEPWTSHFFTQRKRTGSGRNPLEEATRTARAPAQPIQKIQTDKKNSGPV